MIKYFIVLSLWLCFPVALHAGGFIEYDISDMPSRKASEVDTYHNVIKKTAPSYEQAEVPAARNSEYSTVCITSYGSCLLQPKSLVNTPCYCVAPTGVVYGIAK